MEPESQAGQLSPDGMWRWDGRQWVPTGAHGGPPRASRRWLWWLAGGCVVLLVLGVVGVVAGGKVLVDRFQHGAFTCLPSDFPHYPGATVSSESTYTGTNGSECRMTLDSNDSVSSVGPYYQTWLDQGDWSVRSVDYKTGTISFQRRSRAQTSGTVKLTRLGQGARIKIDLHS